MKRKAAFTLVEMLTVIVIIGILASAMFVVITRARITARVAACKAGLQNLNVALSQYETDFAVFPNDQRPGYTGADSSGRALKYALSDWQSNKPYYQGNEKNSKDGKFIDGFGPTGRDVWWYIFDNNDAEQGADPPAGAVAGVNWNVTNVKKTKCDVWCSGPDGKDAISGRSPAIVADNVVSALRDTDDIGDW